MHISLSRKLQGWLVWGVLVIAALSLLALAGCAADQPGPTPTPTKTQMPTFTPRPPTATPTDVPPTATETPLPSPTATAEPTATPVPPTATPTQPPPTPTKAPVARSAPPKPTAVPPTAVPDPCASIGGDGCKWRVTGGPSFGANGGLELKLQFIFLHSGRSGEPQGSYFVWVEKDGQKLPISDSVRSAAKASSQGSLGAYNYEYTLGVDKLPGNTVAGHYRLWVLDGNGERDSRDVNFDVPANQGLVWIQFDQAGGG